MHEALTCRRWGTRALKQRGNQTAAKRADIPPLKTPIWGLAGAKQNPPPPPNRQPVDWRRHLADSLPSNTPSTPLSFYFPSLTTWQPVLASRTRTARFLARTVCADIRQQQQMTRWGGKIYSSLFRTERCPEGLKNENKKSENCATNVCFSTQGSYTQHAPGKTEWRRLKTPDGLVLYSTIWSWCYSSNKL